MNDLGEERFAIFSHVTKVICKIPRCEIIFMMFYERFMQSKTLKFDW